MTNNCYYTRLLDGHCVYRVGDPTKRFAKRPRKMSKIYRLSLKVTVPLVHLVFPKIYKMESAMKSFQGKIHMMAFQRKSIKRFVHRSVKVFYNCAMIAIL